jgi:hypothetical protein
VSILDGVDDLVELLVIRFLGLSQLAEPCLFELYLVRVILLDCFALRFMLMFQFIQFLDVVLLHPIYFFDFLVILHLLPSFAL